MDVHDLADPLRALPGSIARPGSTDALVAIPGRPPNLARLPPGGAFQPRCAGALAICATETPGMVRHGTDWTARCWASEPAAEEAINAVTAGKPRGSRKQDDR